MKKTMQNKTVLVGTGFGTKNSLYLEGTENFVVGFFFSSLPPHLNRFLFSAFVDNLLIFLILSLVG